MAGERVEDARPCRRGSRAYSQSGPADLLRSSVPHCTSWGRSCSFRSYRCYRLPYSNEIPKMRKRVWELADESVRKVMRLAPMPNKFIQGTDGAAQKSRAIKTWTPYPAGAAALGLQSEGFRHEVRIRQELSGRSGARRP